MFRITDVLTPEQRSYNMSRIKSGDTKPELLVRKWLWSRGYRYRLHVNGLPGKPDIVFQRKKKAVFVNGCFWHGHGCRYSKTPKTNTEFWKKKIAANVERDNRVQHQLSKLGWAVFVVWECELHNDPERVFSELSSFLKDRVQVL